MKKLLILLFSLLISFNSFGEEELDFSSDTFCNKSPNVQIRNNLYYLPNKEKPYSGENICVYSSNGQYFNRGNFKKGLKVGIWTQWYANGQKTIEHNFKDGKKDGKRTKWFENGQKQIASNWKNGLVDGKLTNWFENGQKQLEGDYKNGKEDGKWTYVVCKWSEIKRNEL